METVKRLDGKVLEIEVSGHVNATTAPELEEIVKADADKANKIVFDFKNVEYISSAGLRVILFTYKMMATKGGSFVIKNLTPEVKSILEMTGFLGFVKVE